MKNHGEEHRETKDTPASGTLPESVGRHLRLEVGEKPIQCWHCLLCHFKGLAKKSLLYSLLARYTLTTRDDGSDIWAGYLVLTTRNLLFVEEGIIRGRAAQRESIPLDQATDLSADDEIMIKASAYGWSWYVSELREVDSRGRSLDSVDAKEVAESIQNRRDSRLAEIAQERKERKARIASFGQNDEYQE